MISRRRFAMGVGAAVVSCAGSSGPNGARAASGLSPALAGDLDEPPQITFPVPPGSDQADPFPGIGQLGGIIGESCEREPGSASFEEIATIHGTLVSQIGAKHKP